MCEKHSLLVIKINQSKWTISITDKSNIKGIATRSIIIILTGSYEYEIVLYEYDAQVQYLSVLRSGPGGVHE